MEYVYLVWLGTTWFCVKKNIMDEDFIKAHVNEGNTIVVGDDLECMCEDLGINLSEIKEA